jgi:hypothetical protein
MQTKEISVNVSKKISKAGTFGSDMISASITITVDEDSEVGTAYLEAWSKCWEQINKQEEELKTHTEIKESIEEEPDWLKGDPEPTTAEPSMETYCKVHQVQMKERDGKFGKFYSHATQQNDKWVYCTGKGWGVK